MLDVKVELLNVNFSSNNFGRCFVVDIKQVAVVHSECEFHVAQYVLKFLECLMYGIRFLFERRTIKLRSR